MKIGRAYHAAQTSVRIVDERGRLRPLKEIVLEVVTCAKARHKSHRAAAKHLKIDRQSIVRRLGPARERAGD